MAQNLGIYTAFAEQVGLIPNTNISSSQLPLNSSSRESAALF